MGKLLNILTVLALIYFVYWMLKRHFRRRKLASQGIEIKDEGIRPITLFSIVMVVMYAAYMLYFFVGQMSADS
ncbi:hypothetical protein [Hydrogenovibrio thermophilus]|jgi:hypothetical protein|uniref:Uncharacterized protein n=1 Tax=Hydrogenovibrio thermophilus TaxID=265883 RepID=A0A410H2K9_9GAMM|nr:hypothetical protein [Hydrogenovibrio thermophilus]QAB15151.1 hypothetical protein EPV75_05435 [Hydrogenovibrio thermophilus]